MRAERVRRFVALLLFSAWCGVAAGDAGRAVSGLESACRTGDRAVILREVGALKQAWGRNPDFDLIARVVGDRAADPTLRWVMIDSLVVYKRDVRTRREASALLDLLDGVSWDAHDPSPVRAKALTVGGGALALFIEKGIAPEARRVSFSKRLASLIESERIEELLAAACIAAGRAGAREAVPALRRRLLDEKCPAIVRRTAAGSLGLLKDRGSIPLLAGVLDGTEDRALFGAAAYSLGTIGGEEVLGILVEHAGRAGGSSCRNALRRNTETIGRVLRDPGSPHLTHAARAAALSDMREAVPALQALEADPRPDVRAAARDARAALRGEARP